MILAAMADTLDYQTPAKKKRSTWKIILPLAFIAVFLGVFVVIPTLNRLRQNTGSNRTPATDHLHQIGLGLLLYANANGGKMPDTLADMIVREGMSPAVLIDPASNETPATGTTPQAMVADIAKGAHQTYIYLGAGLTNKTADATTLIAYEPLSVYQTGTNALYGDGYSEWIRPEELKKELAERSRAATQPATGP